MNLIEAYKSVLDALFAKYAANITDCESNRQLVAERVDGVNLSIDHFEVVLKELVADGSIQAKSSAQQLQEQEWERARLERAQKHADNDYKRKLRDPNFSREDGQKELRRLRKQEQAVKSDEQKALENMTPAELRAHLRDADKAKGYVRPIRSGDEASEIW